LLIEDGQFVVIHKVVAGQREIGPATATGITFPFSTSRRLHLRSAVVVIGLAKSGGLEIKEELPGKTRRGRGGFPRRW
jgi:hypothetical protein